MRFEFLIDRPEAVPIVARWYFDEWGHFAPEYTFETTCQSIAAELSRDTLPVAMLAIEDDSVVGVAELKAHEMLSLYPDREPWLGSVFVRPESRGGGIASRLASKIAELAEARGAEHLYLQTERLDGGLYARLGWKPLEQVNYRGQDVLVMVKSLDPRASAGHATLCVQNQQSIGGTTPRANG